MSLKDNLAKLEAGTLDKEAPAPKPVVKKATKKRAPTTKSKVISKEAFTDKQFAHAMIQCSMNASSAYRSLKPGCTDKTASVEGCKRLAKPSVVAILAPMLEKLFVKAGIETEYVFRRWIEFSLATPLDYFDIDDEGNMVMKATDSLTPAQRTNLRKITITENSRTDKDGEKFTTQRIMLEVVDQQKAVSEIAKHLGLLVEKLDAEDETRIGDMLERCVKRIKDTKDLGAWRSIVLDAEFAEVKQG